jgi:polygalacturonase
LAGSAGLAGSGGQGGGAATVVCYPTPTGATKSTLYAVTANGTPMFVEKLTKFSPEMQVHYAHCSLVGSGPATLAVTVNESFNSFTLSPKSRKLAATKSGNTISFSSGPNYLILQVDTKELLFILLDAEEVNPPRLGDANVKNIADYSVDNTGATLVTSKVQSAIDAASGATQNILYFPPGRYKVGELWLKSNMTLYLAGGALLYGSSATGDFNTGSGGVDIEGCVHGMLRMYKVNNTKLLGRGVIDANGKAIRAQNDTKINLVKIEQSSNILIDGVLVRDPSFWNTLIYRSELVTISNYKMINCRPTTTTYNNTDGVNFDESTNGKLSNAFLYTGDDSMATKNEEPSGTVNTKNILHEKVVCYSNSVGCKVGTKTMGQSIDGVVFRDIDVVKAGRALNIDAYDTAVVQNTKFENIRIEAADSSMIDLSLDMPPDWRDAANTSIIKDTYFTNVSSDVKKPITLHGKSSSVNVVGVHFSNLTVQGNAVTTQTDADASWSINSFVSGITFGAAP